MGKALVTGTATAVAAIVVVAGARAFGPSSAAFAFVVVWAPMAWLGTVSRFLRVRLPERWHELRAWEVDGRVYERIGVQAAKRLLRRGPLAAFNPGLHLPVERTPEQLARLEDRMKLAEACHLVLLAATLGVAANAAIRGWWLAAGLTVLFDLLMNGYPVMLQRYNRAALHARFPGLFRQPADVATC